MAKEIPLTMDDVAGLALIATFANAEDGTWAPWARELMGYLYAYAPGYTNDEALIQIAKELGDSNINVANAFVIRARAKDCSLLTGDRVVELVSQFEDDTSVHAANLHHNAARFFLDKPANDGSYHLAISYLNEAIKRYGMDKNFHHRAAANFWKSQAREKLGNLKAATEAMKESVRLWEEQCKLDPTNDDFSKKYKTAKGWLATLIGEATS